MAPLHGLCRAATSSPMPEGDTPLLVTRQPSPQQRASRRPQAKLEVNCDLRHATYQQREQTQGEGGDRQSLRGRRGDGR